MLDRTGSGGHDDRHGTSRPHFPQTLVLLDYTGIDEVEQAPIPPGRHRAPDPGWRDRRRIVGAVSAAAIVTAGTVIGGALAMHAPSSAKDRVSANKGPVPQVVVITTAPQTPVAKPVQHHPKPRPTHTAAPPPSPKASPSPKPTATKAPPAIVVTYKVNSDWGNGFQGVVTVTNNGSSTISGWQIVVALPEDQFTGWWNATGHANNGVLLLNQPSWGGQLAPHGGTWSVYFNANGAQTTPTACAFNGVTCSE